MDVPIPWRVQIEDINKYVDLAFGDTFEPLLETGAGNVRLVCSKKMANAVRKGVVIRGEDLKGRTKRTGEANNNNEEVPSDDGE